MKKLFFILSLIAYTNVYSQWTVVSQVPSFSVVNSISVVNQNVIWVACDTAHLYKTTNGGVNWLLRNGGLPSGNLYGISALDTSNCWVGNINGSIYRTNNGGMSWTLQFSLAGSFSNGIKMFDLNYGVYFGDPTGNGQPFQYRYTTNGGTNWLLSPNALIGANEYGVINAWDWLDTGRFWIGSANTVPNSTSARIFITSSGFGGGTWSPVMLSGTGGSDGLFYQTIAFTDANNGMAGSNGTSLRKTTNGGITWQAVAGPAGIASFYSYNMNGMKDGSNTIRVCLGISATFKCFKTTNLGSEWIEEPLPALGQANGMQHMQFPSSSLGFSGGRGGTIMKYTIPTDITPVNNNIPAGSKLEQNFPNPFNPNTIISYQLSNSNFISLKVYDILGNEVADLVNEKQVAGKYSVEFNAGKLSSGVYFYKLESDDFIETKQMIILK